MSYCRFENTYQDLQDCYDALQESGSVNELEKDRNEYEKKYVRKLVEMCKNIAEEFGDYDEEDEEDEED
jgi:hypothetical protein